MTVGQSITVLTLGVAFTIGAGGIIAGLAVLYFPWLYLTISIALDGGSLRISPAWLATIMAAGGVAAAVGLVKAEQAVAGWLAYRELAKLKASYRDVELALGTEKANEYLLFNIGRPDVVTDPPQGRCGGSTAEND